MLRFFSLLLIPLLLVGCGSSCASGELEEKLNGEWLEVPSESLDSQEALMERILFGDPPSPEEVRQGLEWELHDDALGLLAMRLKTSRTNAEEQKWTTRALEFREKQERRRQTGSLTVDGSVMVFTRGVKEQRATYTLDSEEDGIYWIMTTDKMGKRELQEIYWVDETRFRMTDPAGETVEFTRP
jgi:hypothetical protein